MRKREAGATKGWLIILLTLLDDAAVVVVVLLVLQFLGIKLSLWLLVVLALLFGGFIFITYKVIIPTLRRKKITGWEGMIGLVGRVTEALTPVGVIKVEGEYWKAKSVDEDIAAGEKVEILGVDSITLTVRLKD